MKALYGLVHNAYNCFPFNFPGISENNSTTVVSVNMHIIDIHQIDDNDQVIKIFFVIRAFKQFLCLGVFSEHVHSPEVDWFKVGVYDRKP